MVTHGQDLASSSRLKFFWICVYAAWDSDVDSGQSVAADKFGLQRWISRLLSDASNRGLKEVRDNMNGVEDFIGCSCGFHGFEFCKHEFNLKVLIRIWQSSLLNPTPACCSLQWGKRNWSKGLDASKLEKQIGIFCESSTDWKKHWRGRYWKKK